MALYGRTPTKTALTGVERTDEEKYYGLGWPVGEKSGVPYFRKVSKTDLIRSQVKQILLTRKGERLMLPGFGVSLQDYMFQQLDEIRAYDLALSISESIRVYAPNIEVVSVNSRISENLRGFGIPGLLVRVVVRDKKDKSIVEVGVTV